MHNGFIFFNNIKIPFAIDSDNIHMQVFSDNESDIKSFLNSYAHKQDFVLKGNVFNAFSFKRDIFCFVSSFKGKLAILNSFATLDCLEGKNVDKICFQSSLLDDIFQYKYRFLELARGNVNISNHPVVTEHFDFSFNNEKKTAEFLVGQDSKFGFMNTFKHSGVLEVGFSFSEIDSLFSLVTLVKRYVIFLTSFLNISFSDIFLTKKGLRIGTVFLPLSKNENEKLDVLFFGFKNYSFSTKIIENLAIDLGSEIKQSIPLFHMKTEDNFFDPSRFLRQVMSFEYLYKRIEANNHKNKRETLSNKLCCMMRKFPDHFSNCNGKLFCLAKNIADFRNSIFHGGQLFYNREPNDNFGHFFFIMDSLIEKMSLLYLGLNEIDIDNFRPNTWIL